MRKEWCDFLSRSCRCKKERLGRAVCSGEQDTNPGVIKIISVCYSIVKLVLELTKSGILNISPKK